MGKQEQFAALLAEVARRVERRRSSDACCGELTLEQFETLRTVEQAEIAGQSSMTFLSGALKVDLSTISRNVTVLERNGYLRRTRVAGDGRRVVVRLTARGRNALVSLQCGEREVLGDVYQRLPAAERVVVVKALDLLVGCLAQLDDGDGDAATTACCPPVPVRLVRRVS